MLNKLVRGNKYTLVGNDGFLNFNMKITLIDFMYVQYAQYHDGILIKFKRKGGRKIYEMFLNWEYSFLEGWKDIFVSKKINENLYERLAYKDLKLDNVVVRGKVGTTKINKNYESLIEYSCKVITEYGFRSDKYFEKLKEIFTELNFSLNNELIQYFKENHNYFMGTIEGLRKM